MVSFGTLSSSNFDHSYRVSVLCLTILYEQPSPSLAIAAFVEKRDSRRWKEKANEREMRLGRKIQLFLKIDVSVSLFFKGKIKNTLITT